MTTNRHIAPSVMVCVVVAQYALVATTDLSPWKGGGFGMFATVDAPDSRTLSAQGVDRSNHQYRLSLEESISSRDLRLLKTMPIENHVRQVAQTLLDTAYVASLSRRRRSLEVLQRHNPGASLPAPEADEGLLRARQPVDLPETPGYRLIEVEISTWRLDFDVGTRRATLTRVGNPVRLVAGA